MSAGHIILLYFTFVLPLPFIQKVSHITLLNTPAQPQKTADAATLPIYGGMTVLMLALLSALVVYRRKRRAI